MEHLRRNSLRWLAVLAIALIGAAAVPPSPARAAAPQKLTPMKLTADVRDGLMALAPLRGPGIDRSLFDGRPILVTFFASW